MNEEKTEEKRIRWLCAHRSMHEMDIVLGHFLDIHYESLAPQQKEVFHQLANLQDIELWPRVSGRVPAATPEEAEILSLLRQVRLK